MEEKITKGSAIVDFHNDNFIITVETEKGDIYLHEKTFNDSISAEYVANIVNLIGTINIDHWNYVRTVYGSKSYIEGGFELHKLEKERMGD